MLIAAIASIVSVVLGVLLAAGRGVERAWLFAPVRTFALAAVVASLVAHLMPEAVEGIGIWAPVALVAGFVLPTSLGWLGRRARVEGHGHEGLALELGYVGLLVHKVGDGIGLGTYAGPAHAEHGHWGILVGIVAHTVPVTAIVVIAFAESRGMRAAVLRAGGLAAAMVGGVIAAAWGTGQGLGTWQPWVSAAVAGLLLHVLAHDLPIRPRRTTLSRLLEVVGLGAGVALPLVAGAAHAHGAHVGVGDTMIDVLSSLTLVTAPVLVVGFVASAAVQTFVAPWARRVLTGGPLHGIASAAAQPSSACGVPETVHRLTDAGASVSFVFAAALAAPHLGLETLALTVQLLGWPLALARLAGAAALALLAGLIAARVARAGSDPHEPPPAPACPPVPRLFVDSLDHLLRHAAPWLMVGWIAAAFVAAAVPADGIASAVAVHLALTALVALPAYIPAPALVPLAAVLIGRGVSPGVALAALLLGPFVSVAIAGVLRRHVGTPATVAAVTVVIVGSLAAATIVHVGGVELEPGFAIDPGGWTARASALVLGVLVVRTMWRWGAEAWLAELGASHEHVHHHPHAHEPPSVVCDR